MNPSLAALGQFPRPGLLPADETTRVLAATNVARKNARDGLS
jgi:hypothetical protein